MNSPNVSVAATLEVYKPASAEPWYLFVDLWLADDGSDIKRLVRNHENLSFRGLEYEAFNFVLEPVEDAVKGELTSVTLKVDDVTGALQETLETTSGLTEKKVVLYFVNGANLDGETDLILEFSIAGTARDDETGAIVFTLGATSPIRKKFPKFQYLRDRCFRKYNSPAMQAALDPTGGSCGYAGPLATCKKTLADCRAHGNAYRFGGFPAIDSVGYRGASVL